MIYASNTGEHSIEFEASTTLNGHQYYTSPKKDRGIYYSKQNWIISPIKGYMGIWNMDVWPIIYSESTTSKCPSDIPNDKWYCYKSWWKPCRNDIKIECQNNNNNHQCCNNIQDLENRIRSIENSVSGLCTTVS